MHQPGLEGALDAGELSDGTLRCLLLAPLARLIAAVAGRTQVWVIAHAEALITALATESGCSVLRLHRDQGTTVLPGQTVLERAAWRWPG